MDLHHVNHGRWGVYAILVFVMGMATGFNDVVANTLVVLLVVGSFVLAPAIVLHYAVRAAIDEERGETQGDSDV